MSAKEPVTAAICSHLFPLNLERSKSTSHTKRIVSVQVQNVSLSDTGIAGQFPLRHCPVANSISPLKFSLPLWFSSSSKSWPEGFSGKFPPHKLCNRSELVQIYRFPKRSTWPDLRYSHVSELISACLFPTIAQLQEDAWEHCANKLPSCSGKDKPKLPLLAEG